MPPTSLRHPAAPEWLLPFVQEPPDWGLSPTGRPEPRIPLLQSLYRHRWEILAHYPRLPLYPSSWGPSHPPSEVGPLLGLWVLSPWFSGVCPGCEGLALGLAAGGRANVGDVRGLCLGCGAELARRSPYSMHDYTQRLLIGLRPQIEGYVPFCIHAHWTPHPEVIRLTERLDARAPALTALLRGLDAAQGECAALVRQADLASPDLNTLLLQLPGHPEGIP